MRAVPESAARGAVLAAVLVHVAASAAEAAEISHKPGKDYRGRLQIQLVF